MQSKRQRVHDRKSKGENLEGSPYSLLLNNHQVLESPQPLTTSKRIFLDSVKKSGRVRMTMRGKTVETISAAVNDESVVKQDKDVRSIGGIAFQ